MVHDQGSTFESLLLAINNLDMLLNTAFNRCQSFDYYTYNIINFMKQILIIAKFSLLNVFEASTSYLLLQSYLLMCC